MRDVLLDQLRWRYAVKKFDATKKITSQDWETLESALVLSPSSYGLQPWKFLVVQNPGLRKQLTPASWNQTQVEDCSHYVVFTAKTSIDEAYIASYISHVSKVRGVPTEKMAAYQKMMTGDLVSGNRSGVIAEWAARQAYIALGGLMTSAAMLKIDTCPMEGIEPAQYDDILGLKASGYHTLVCCALGYRHSEDPLAKLQKVRFDKTLVIKRFD